MNCKTCGSTVDISDKYCPVCGEKISIVDNIEEPFESKQTGKRTIIGDRHIIDKSWGALVACILLFISFCVIVLSVVDYINEPTIGDPSVSGSDLNRHRAIVNCGNGYYRRTWYVLTEQTDPNGRKMLLLACEDSGGELPYEESGINTTWRDCSLRRYLNTSFYDSYFSEDAKELIIPAVDGAPVFSHSTGEEKSVGMDYVFLLNNSEAKKYYYSNEWGHNKGWWLRSGDVLSSSGEISSVSDPSVKNSIRPAIWIYNDSPDPITSLFAGANMEAGNDEMTFTFTDDSLYWDGGDNGWYATYEIKGRDLVDDKLYLYVLYDSYQDGEGKGRKEIQKIEVMPYKEKSEEKSGIIEIKVYAYDDTFIGSYVCFYSGLEETLTENRE